jgi:hypothetical protein
MSTTPTKSPPTAAWAAESNAMRRGKISNKMRAPQTAPKIETFLLELKLISLPVPYLGVEVDHAFKIAENIDV